MHLVDTCGWIEWVTDSELAPSFAAFLTSTEKLVVPTLVQHELYKWMCREVDKPAALSVIAVTQTAKVIPLDTSLALQSAEIAKEFGLAMADAIIYATAREALATLVTSDAHFEKLPNVHYIPKRK